MKIYCSCCDKVQPVRIDNCRDAKTNEPFQDIVCAECDLVIASGTGIDSPASKPWVGLTDEEIEAEFGFIDELLRDCCYRTEAKLREKNG